MAPDDSTRPEASDTAPPADPPPTEATSDEPGVEAAAPSAPTPIAASAPEATGGAEPPPVAAEAAATGSDAEPDAPTADAPAPDAPAPDAPAPPGESGAPEAEAAAATEAYAEAATEAYAEAATEAAAGSSQAPSPENRPPAGGGESDGKKRRKRRRKKKPAAATQSKASDRAPFHVGEEVFGKVTAVLETAIMIDLSGKALAIFDRGEMEADDLLPAEGDRFVARIHNDGGRGGLVVLTRKPLREEASKERVEKAHQDGHLIEGLVTGVIKGGVEVDIDGLRAFAPASGMDLHPAQANLTNLVGSRLDFKVIQYDKGGRDVVVTRRPMLESEAHDRRKQALTLLQEGQVLKGVVRTVVEWGAFIALPEAESLEGLVHISEASHDARARLADLMKPGEQFDVKILKIDERGKIWLSRKALLEDPWAEAREKYKPGTRLQGAVKRLEPFGAFIELEPGLDGLLFTQDLSAFDRIEHPKEKLKEGEALDVVVHQFDVRNRRLALHPAPKAEHADEPHQKVQRNSVVKAEVVKVESGGIVMRLLGVTGRMARAFLPAAQTGTARGTDLRRTFKQGKLLDAKVIDLHPRSGEAKLSIRAAHEDEERRAHREYRQKVKAEAKFGTLGDLLRAKLNVGQKSDD